MSKDDDICEEEKRGIDHGFVILLTEAISNVFLRKRSIHGDVPLRVIELRLVILIWGEDLARKTGVRKQFRYDVQKVAVEVAPLSMARVEVRKPEGWRQGGNVFWTDDELEFGAEVQGQVRGIRRARSSRRRRWRRREGRR